MLDKEKDVSIAFPSVLVGAVGSGLRWPYDGEQTIGWNGVDRRYRRDDSVSAVDDRL